MKVYKVSIKKFLAVKSMLDQAVFWRLVDDDMVEIKPVFKFAKKIVEQIAEKTT